MHAQEANNQLSQPIEADSSGLQRTFTDHSHQLIARMQEHSRVRAFPDKEGVGPCQPRARTKQKPETLTSTRTTTKPALTSIAAAESRPGIDMVRRQSVDKVDEHQAVDDIGQRARLMIHHLGGQLSDDRATAALSC